MRILAIDTSSPAGSLALLAEGRLVAGAALEGQRYSTELMPGIERLLSRAGCLPGELDALAVAVGPGAFTGLRVGIGSAQGLALGLRRPCLGVNTFEAWAALHRDEEHLAVTLDALRGELLGGLWEHGQPAGPPRTLAPEAFAVQAPSGTLFAGGGAQVYRNALEGNAREPRFAGSECLAESVGRLAAQALASGARGAARELRPLYLREAYARQP